MEQTEYHARMWADLVTSEIAAKTAAGLVIDRAVNYLEAGLPLDQVLDALKISRATWYRRLEARGDERERNRQILAASDARRPAARLSGDLADDEGQGD